MAYRQPEGADKEPDSGVQILFPDRAVTLPCSSGGFCCLSFSFLCAMKWTGFFLLLLSGGAYRLAAQSLLLSGPMAGYADHREAAVWVQVKKPLPVQIAFWDLKNPSVRRVSKTKVPDEGQAGALTFVLDSLSPGTRYGYEVRVNGKPEKRPYPLEFQTPVLWQFRSDPPDFQVAAGSCAYVNEEAWDRPGKPYGDSLDIFATIHRARPDLMLWIGDNTYTREGDWNSWGGFLHRYTHTRSAPELQPLLASAQHYATWDDHEYGPNDADRSFWNKSFSSRAFELFWPQPPGQPLGPGPVTRTFSWGDCQFFLLDDRWFRAPNGDKDSTKPYLGEAQLQWLTDALTFSKANFKIIACGGQVISDARVYENYATYPVERRMLIERITRARIPGVFFLSGDRHHAELSRLERPGTYPLYDLTTSPLTAGIHKPGNEGNTLRVEGTLFNGHNFALLRFSGPARERVMKISLCNNRGQAVWEREIRASELR